MEFNLYLDNLEKKLTRSFDIKRDWNINGVRYDMFAEYHLRNEKYVLVKTAVIYAFENNEYFLVKRFEQLDRHICKEFTDGLVKSVDALIKPDGNHMSSTLTGVIVVDDLPDSEEILKIIKLFKYNKQFSFGFKGWADIRLLLVSLKGGVIATNGKAKQISSVFDLKPV